MARDLPRISYAAVLLAAVLFALPADAQRIVDFETDQGTISIELIEHPVVAPFARAFFLSGESRRGAIFHKSDKSLQCTVQTCSCFDVYDCNTPGGLGVCEDGAAPLPTCEDGDLADCECEDMATSPSFSCTTLDGPSFDCPPPAGMDETNDLMCTCDDGSIPLLTCEDESPLPGTCTGDLVQTDKAMPSATLHFGLYRMDEDGQVVAVDEFIRPVPPNPALDPRTPGIFQNAPGTVAFVRDLSSCDMTGCELTSEIVINVEDNSDPYDGFADDGSDAYMVFGVLVGGGPNAVDTIARIATFDFTAEVDQPAAVPPDPEAPAVKMSCFDVPPPPLTDWIDGIPDAARCDATNPWDEFAIIDETDANPLPRIKGCFASDASCQLPVCMTPGPMTGCDDPLCPEVAMFGAELRCTAPLSLKCLELGEPFPDGEGNTITPCIDPICEDTFDDSGETRCTDPPPLNFPVPEPGTQVLGIAALAAVVMLRRLRRRS